jgi:hypothetical protein
VLVAVALLPKRNGSRDVNVPIASPQQVATPGRPQPGPAPAGKVWSVEHGHWHDAAPAQGGASPVRIEQTAGAAPPGARPLQLAQGSARPQPPGPVPPGKVWSAEHGHWHDAAPPAPPAQPQR